jgi:hypothetical protein
MLAIGLALLAAACRHGSPGTQFVHFVPDQRVVSEARPGSCFGRSLALRQRSDAWRCSTDNEVHDPCFALDPDFVVSDADPAARLYGFRLALTASLPEVEQAPADSSVARVRAITAIVQVGARLLETGEIEERVAALEAAMATR